MIFGETKLSITYRTFEEIQEVLNAIHKDPLSGLIQTETIKRDYGFFTVEIQVLMKPETAGALITKIFPSVAKVMFPLSNKESKP